MDESLSPAGIRSDSSETFCRAKAGRVRMLRHPSDQNRQAFLQGESSRRPLLLRRQKTESLLAPPFNKGVGDFVEIVINRGGASALGDGHAFLIYLVAFVVGLEDVFSAAVLPTAL